MGFLQSGLTESWLLLVSLLVITLFQCAPTCLSPLIFLELTGVKKRDQKCECNSFYSCNIILLQLCMYIYICMFIYICIAIRKTWLMRERHQYLKSGSIHNKWGWPDSPQTGSNLVYADTQLWSAKGIFPSQSNLRTFFLYRLFSCPLWPPLLPLTFYLKIYCPS